MPGVNMLRSKNLKTVSCGLVCMFLACIVSAQGTTPKTVPVKITTKENAPDVLKRLKQVGAAENLEFVNDTWGYVYWIEYTVKECDPAGPGESSGPYHAPGSSRPAARNERSDKDVECVVHGGNGINGGYQFSVHRRRPEPGLGIADKVAKEIVKRIAKDLRRKPVLSPGRANSRLECAKMAA
jgi:hypothetical protein